MINNKTFYVPQKYIDPYPEIGCVSIPHGFIDDNRLSDVAFKVYILILSLVSPNKSYFSYEEFPEFAKSKLDKNKVDKAFAELIKFKYIKTKCRK